MTYPVHGCVCVCDIVFLWLCVHACVCARVWHAVYSFHYIAPLQVSTLLDSLEFIIVPIVNPDGYAVSTSIAIGTFLLSSYSRALCVCKPWGNDTVVVELVHT